MVGVVTKVGEEGIRVTGGVGAVWSGLTQEGKGFGETIRQGPKENVRTIRKTPKVINQTNNTIFGGEGVFKRDQLVVEVGRETVFIVPNNVGVQFLNKCLVTAMLTARIKELLSGNRWEFMVGGDTSYRWLGKRER